MIQDVSDQMFQKFTDGGAGGAGDGRPTAGPAAARRGPIQAVTVSAPSVLVSFGSRRPACRQPAFWVGLAVLCCS